MCTVLAQHTGEDVTSLINHVHMGAVIGANVQLLSKYPETQLRSGGAAYDSFFILLYVRGFSFILYSLHSNQSRGAKQYYFSCLPHAMPPLSLPTNCTTPKCIQPNIMLQPQRYKSLPCFAGRTRDAHVPITSCGYAVVTSAHFTCFT